MRKLTTSPTGTSTGNTADIPESLISTDIPGIRPNVGDLTVTSTSNLNRGYRRASVTLFDPACSSKARPSCLVSSTPFPLYPEILFRFCNKVGRGRTTLKHQLSFT